MVSKSAARLAIIVFLSITSIQCSVIEPTLLSLRYPNLHPVIGFTGYHGPRWSSDGTQIVFFDLYGTILTVSRNGGPVQSLPSLAANGMQPDWSPDGKKIALASKHSGLWQVYLTNMDGTETVQLTRLRHAGCPKWSPDGRRIAFCGKAESEDEPSQIYVMHTDGTNIIRLTGSPLGQVNIFEWSPNGNQIVFTAVNIATRKNDPMPGNLEEYGPHMYIINLDGSGLLRLNQGIRGEYYPTWSPDGKHILFDYTGYAMPDGFYLLNLEGLTMQRVLDEPTCQFPNWSRTTNQVVFLCSTGTNTTQLFTLDMKDWVK